MPLTENDRFRAEFDAGYAEHESAKLQSQYRDIRKKRKTALIYTVIEAVILLIIFYKVAAFIPFVGDWIKEAHIFFKDLIFGAGSDRTALQAFFKEAQDVIKDSIWLTLLYWFIYIPAPWSLIYDSVKAASYKKKIKKSNQSEESRSDDASKAEWKKTAKRKKKAVKKAKEEKEPSPAKPIKLLGLFKSLSKERHLKKILKNSKDSVFKDDRHFLRVQKLTRGDSSREREKVFAWGSDNIITYKDTVDGEPFHIKIVMQNNGTPCIEGERPVALHPGTPVVIYRNTRDLSDPSNDMLQYVFTYLYRRNNL